MTENPSSALRIGHYCLQSLDFRQRSEETARKPRATMSARSNSFPDRSVSETAAGVRSCHVELIWSSHAPRRNGGRSANPCKCAEHGESPVVSVQVRARRWLTRLQAATGKICVPTEAALRRRSLWSVVRDLAADDLFGNRDIRIWVCSAGYGLVPLSGRIHPYSATFSAGHPDSVSRDLTVADGLHALWWELLAQWEGPAPGTPRSIAALAESFPDDLLLVVMSETYLTATALDLLKAVGQAS